MELIGTDSAAASAGPASPAGPAVQKPNESRAQPVVVLSVQGGLLYLLLHTTLFPHPAFMQAVYVVPPPTASAILP